LSLAERPSEAGRARRRTGCPAGIYRPSPHPALPRKGEGAASCLPNSACPPRGRPVHHHAPLTRKPSPLWSARHHRGSAMSHAQLAQIIDAAFENRAEVTFATKGEIRDAVDAALLLLDNGEARV